MSYIPNPSIGGLAGMLETNNGVVMGIDQVNTYHPFWTSGVVTGTVDGWTFLAGVSGSYTSVTNLGAGLIRFTTSAPHGMSAGQVVTITSASVAGYQPPNPVIFVIQAAGASTFDVIATFTATATGTFARGASLTAGAAAAGKYELIWSASTLATAPNKLYLFTPCQNVTPATSTSASQLTTNAGPQSCSAPAPVVITVAAGDIFTMLCQNQTDTTDITIVYFNYSLRRYSPP